MNRNNLRPVGEVEDILIPLVLGIRNLRINDDEPAEQQPEDEEEPVDI